MRKVQHMLSIQDAREKLMHGKQKCQVLYGFVLVCGRYSCDDAWQGPGEDGRTTIKFVVPPGDEASENQFASLGTL